MEHTKERAAGIARLHVPLVYVLLAVLVVAVFARVVGFGFVNYDDDLYVVGNEHVRGGLTLDGIRWALTAVTDGTWQPLVWLSYMLDAQVGLAGAAAYHLTSVLLHLLNVLLLFHVFRRMTGATGRAWFVAALFAVHPLHVEAVAWVASRKDVLSTLFWLLAMLAYVRFVEKPGAARYGFVVLAFALGLMAKPMVVTLPLVLLLMDYWPLGRWGRAGAFATSAPVRRLLWEKAPLLALAVLAGIMAVHAQHEGGTLAELDVVPLWPRVANALASYVGYLGKMFWPARLAAFYPHPGATLPVLRVAASAAGLAVLTALAFRLARPRAYLVAGWLWYIVTLLPVIGIVQFGSHAMADRFTYVPLIGPFLIVTWGVPDLVAKLRPGASPASVLAAPSAAVVLALALLSWRQAGYWRDGIALFEHALESTPSNYVAHTNLGIALAAAGRTDEAIRHYQAAIALNPRDRRGYNNLGEALSRERRYAEAEASLREALRIDPGYAHAHLNLGNAFAAQGKTELAVDEYREAIRLDDRDPVSRVMLGRALKSLGRRQEAEKAFREAIRVSPGYAPARLELGALLADLGKPAEATAELREAVRIDPRLPQARNNLAVALFMSGDYAGAWREVAASRRLGLEPNPNFLRALSQKMPEP